MKRIAITGGSFNPPHKGHEHIGKTVYESTNVNEVWMWVSRNPFKSASEYPDEDTRMKMCSVLAEGKEWLKVTNIESNFHDTKTASSMTLLKEMFPETQFIWAFGDDNFTTFQDWNDERFRVNNKIVPDWQYLMHNFSVVVINRSGSRAESMNSIAANYGRHLYIENPADLSVLKNGWAFVDSETLPYSSTGIKDAIARGERNIDGLRPENEKLIYDQGLFGLSNRFDGVAHISTTNNKVRFQTFTMVANTINLVKSLQADHTECIHHFSKCWDKSEAKGDLKKYEDVPGEIADCLISLYWIAAHQNIDLPILPQGSETQISVNQWCETHYPNRPIKQKLMDYVEELAELCVCEGLEKHRAMNIISEIFHADDLVNPKQACNSNFEKLNEYAADLGIPLNTILDDKMKINRARTLEQSRDRETTKRGIIKRYPT